MKIFYGVSSDGHHVHVHTDGQDLTKGQYQALCDFAQKLKQSPDNPPPRAIGEDYVLIRVGIDGPECKPFAEYAQSRPL